jgi:hypothetical protein
MAPKSVSQIASIKLSATLGALTERIEQFKHNDKESGTMATKTKSASAEARREMQLASIELSAALGALANRIEQFGVLVGGAGAKTIDQARLDKIAEIYVELASQALPALVEHAERVAKCLHEGDHRGI